MNNTDYPLRVAKEVKQLEEASQYKKLKDYQRIAVEYMLQPEVRGILLYHETGSGKTITSSAICHSLLKRGYRVFFVSKKTLHENFRTGMQKFLGEIHDGGESADTVLEQIKFITLNSSRMFDSFGQQDLLTLRNDVKLDNSLVVLDEAHNLFNSITNASSNAVKLYDVIMHTKGVKLLFMTGTPMINHPFEIMPCMNMLRGYLEGSNTCLPENFEQFKQLLHKIPKFQNRIYGLASYYGTRYAEQRVGFPREFPLKIVRLPMTQPQYDQYYRARSREQQEAKFGQKTVRLSKPRSLGSSTYRIGSRQASNVPLPFTREMAHDPKKYSNKLHHLLEVLPGAGKSIVFSNFNQAGILPLIECLEDAGHTRWMPSAPTKSRVGAGDDVWSDEISNYYEPRDVFNDNVVVGDDDGVFNDNDVFGNAGSSLTFTYITGEVAPDVRGIIIERFNAPDNLHGEKINILIISGAAAEGIDTVGVRSVFIMEATWNYALIKQVIARAVRYRSHEALPEAEREVQPYIYLSDYPINTPKEIASAEPTTDLQMFKESMKNRALIEQFEQAIVEVSIDCDVLNPETSGIHCRLCNPTNSRLYHPEFGIDIDLDDPCEQHKTSKVEVKEIGVGNKKYYYKIDDPSAIKRVSAERDDVIKLRIIADISDVFKYSPEFGGYVKVDDTDENYEAILREIGVSLQL